MERGGEGSRECTPGPTPAMMAMYLVDMVLRCETTEKRRVVGRMKCRWSWKGLTPVWLMFD